MATYLFFQVAPSGTTATANGGNQTVTATSVGSPITIGHNVLVRLVATGPLQVRFGAAGTNTATTNDIYLPAGVPEIFDMGRYNEVIVPYNAGASSATLYYSVVNKT